MMPVFSNPFLPFFNPDLGSNFHSVAFRDPIGHTFAVAERFGDQTFLRDQIGQHIGSIQHFTNDTDLIKDAIGHTEGTLHHFGNMTTLADNLGQPQLVAHQVGDHLLVHDQIGHQLADIHQFGNSVMATDPIGHVEWTSNDV